jgi:lantibiotic modifying enzyme
MEAFIETDITAAVHRIARSLASPANSLPAFGYSKGVLGQVLFWSYYAYFADDSTAQERVKTLLVESVQRVTQPYAGHSFTKELAEFGIFLEYANANSLVELDTNALLTGPDQLLAATMTDALNRRDFDPYTGALGPGYYFLSRAASQESARQVIDQLVVGLHRIAVADEVGHLYWPSQLFGDNRVYLGLSHGSAAILLFLCRAIELGIQVDLASGMVQRAVGFLLVHQQNYQQIGSFFPDIVHEKPAQSRLGLCYGDMGVAYSLLRAGQVLNDHLIEEEGLAVFTFSATRRSPAESGIRDAGILYGASGTALLFDKAYELTGQPELDEAARHWYDRIPDFATHDNATAGYQGVFNQHFPHTNVGFMEGIAGIGATLIKSTQRDTYSFDELIWLV